MAEFAALSELRENPMFTELERPGAGKMVAARNPLRFGALPESPVQPASVLGQHTGQVLSQLLSIGTAECGRLRDARIAG